jgi:hypothetical protein
MNRTRFSKARKPESWKARNPEDDKIIVKRGREGKGLHPHYVFAHSTTVGRHVFTEGDLE